MKSIFKFTMIVMAVILNSLVGGTLAAAIGVAPIYGALSMNGVATVVGTAIPAGALGAGLYTEAWTGYMVKALRNTAESLGWYNAIKSFDQYAENDVIHLVHIGVDPTVLINNTSYPLGIETLQDADKAIQLDKYQTKATAITDDEVKALSYDKMASVIERHKEALDAAKYSKAIHALAPNANTTVTPVIVTSGVAGSDGRKKITREDIIQLKKRFDAMKVPTAGRMLVLCNDHVNDLLESDQKFADQYYNYTTGKIANMYGFEIYEYQDNPYYDSNLAKVAYGGEITGCYQASVAFYAPRMMKANGTTKAYLSEAKSDPLNQQNLINFRTYSICLPMKSECIGAIVSTQGTGGDLGDLLGGGGINPGTGASENPTADPTPTISADVESLDFVVAGESKVVTVTCANLYTATISGEGFTKVKSGETVTVTADENTTGLSRQGQLVLKDNVSSDTITIPLVQARS